MSPTARTLNRLRRQGHIAGVVERFIHGAGEHGQGIHSDLFRCIDIIAAKPGCPVLGVQATSLPNVGARLKKATAIPELRVWLAAGALFQVWGWACRNGDWDVKIVEVKADDLEAVVVAVPARQRRRSRWQPTELPF
jgi:hypothetical protein